MLTITTKVTVLGTTEETSEAVDNTTEIAAVVARGSFGSRWTEGRALHGRGLAALSERADPGGCVHRVAMVQSQRHP